jgi:hypothetical protein
MAIGRAGSRWAKKYARCYAKCREYMVMTVQFEDWVKRSVISVPGKKVASDL